ncbi:OmpH family outer membrane protein [Methylomonas sp. SURF-1]|uniref:OmpH family outer membrane protein n=1 Tax=Methylomonas aurea TaxID=2952224 RepID=A0ABT1UDM9_9GAMM|nr:OmpH family outer membrane protein [Methylomonas sp. SURF-1]MCQ8180265.1 OmpH family outer membrane protein [Methylomonas sp. SURF-1]
MKNRISLFLMLMIFAGVGHAELKIGFVNVAKVLEKAPQAAKAKTRLETEFSPRDKALVAQQKEIKTLEEKLSRDSAVMSEDERRRLEKDVLDKKRDAARAQQEFSEDFNMRRNEELGNLQKRIVEAVRALAKEESFDLLLTDGVIYANDQIDVTSRVQQKLETLSQ